MTTKRKDNRNKVGTHHPRRKGYCRFAIHKLGTKIELYTRTGRSRRSQTSYEFFGLYPDQSNLFNQQGEYKLLQDVTNDWYVNSPLKLLPLELAQSFEYTY